jgi:hypothetical protein
MYLTVHAPAVNTNCYNIYLYLAGHRAHQAHPQGVPAWRLCARQRHAAGSAGPGQRGLPLLTVITVIYIWQVIELIKRTPKESPPGDFVPASGTLQGALALDNVAFCYLLL